MFYNILKDTLLLVLATILLGYNGVAQINPYMPFPSANDLEVEIIYPQENKPLDAERLGEFKIKKGHYLACDIVNFLSMAKLKAAEKGGNAIYITSIKPPANGRNCYKIEGDIYRLNEPYKSRPNPFYDSEVFTTTENGSTYTQILPLFPGGVNDMVAFIYRKINYPNSALRDKIGGKIEVSFQVNEDGKISDVQITEGIRWDLDQEVLRVISTMPEWVPEYQNAEAVPVTYTLPIKLYPWLTR